MQSDTFDDRMNSHLKYLMTSIAFYIHQDELIQPFYTITIDWSSFEY